jgi:hypothetical protein
VSEVALVLPATDSGRYQRLQMKSFLQRGKVHTDVVLTTNVTRELLSEMTDGEKGAFTETGFPVGGPDVSVFTLDPVELPPSIVTVVDLNLEEGEVMQRAPGITDEEAAVDVIHNQLKDPIGLKERCLKGTHVGRLTNLQHFGELLEDLPQLFEKHDVAENYGYLAEEHRQGMRQLEGDARKDGDEEEEGDCDYSPFQDFRASEDLAKGGKHPLRERY